MRASDDFANVKAGTPAGLPQMVDTRFLLAQLSIHFPDQPTRLLAKAVEQVAAQLVGTSNSETLLSRARAILAAQQFGHPVDARTQHTRSLRSPVAQPEKSPTTGTVSSPDFASHPGAVR